MHRITIFIPPNKILLARHFLLTEPTTCYAVLTVWFNFCLSPISNLSILSKIIERVVKSRLTHYCSSSNIFNPNQSAYCKHHSTETALLYIHDHPIDSQKISCLCLLDLSAAFHTIDHYIPISRLSSWFRIHGSV